MKKVLLFSSLLLFGLAASQILPAIAGGAWYPLKEAIRILTMAALAFIMIHVGYEFEIDRARLGSYAADYGIAATAAAFPWILASLYFVFFMTPAPAWGRASTWTEAFLAGRFAAPTSAGILFSMLAAAGLSATWVFKKARVLAIFDDLDTVLLMIPLKMLVVGARWQLAVIVLVMAVQIWVAWKWLHRVRLPTSWPWVLLYGLLITALSELIYQSSKLVDEVVPIHIEVLLPAFVIGVILARPAGRDPHADDARDGHQEGPEPAAEQRVSTVVSALFMALVGLSMPSLGSLLGGPGELRWGGILVGVLVVTLLANLGKMFPVLMYRDEASLKERLALSIGMWPRGEVGAGVLVVSLSYGIGGAILTVATLSLALNLVLTGIFILVVKRLLGISSPAPARATPSP